MTQAARDAARSELAAELPKIKAELFKDASLQAVKAGDFSGAALGGQIFKFDQSLFKWDEKGLTFAGQEVKKTKNLSLQQAIHGRKLKAKAEKKEEEEKQKEAATRAELQEIKNDAHAAREDAKNAKKDADAAHKNARQSIEHAARAKRDADVAKNLASSAKRNTQIAATGSREAKASASNAKKSAEQTRKVAGQFLKAMQQIDVQAGGSARNVDSFKRVLKELEREL
ncbi:hypothetical protein LKL35_30245 [Streptomyces sp. ET3-23]|uniref:hypothetical protein n=1 Tax=Streptomyces sp. ET3-23 TaxID=2885643 RepID=UPI001D110917|nr:hypothetical protein [Streptomyces sp. ET3-23]MCC2279678.1 hypothetical protein [Streptomyces sp. ET3-23]